MRYGKTLAYGLNYILQGVGDKRKPLPACKATVIVGVFCIRWALELHYLKGRGYYAIKKKGSLGGHKKKTYLSSCTIHTRRYTQVSNVYVLFAKIPMKHLGLGLYSSSYSARLVAIYVKANGYVEVACRSSDLRLGLVVLRASGVDHQWELVVRDFVRTAYERVLGH